MSEGWRSGTDGLTDLEQWGMQVPIDPLRDAISVAKTCFVLGIPDTRKQWLESLKRTGGLAHQVAWENYEPPATFVAKEFGRGHDLEGAVLRDPARASSFISYRARKRTLLRLAERGLEVLFGASRADFLDALDRRLADGGVVVTIAHAQADPPAFEFTDGFLEFREIRIPACAVRTGLFDAVACRTTAMQGELKAVVGKGVWIVVNRAPRGLAGTLLHRVVAAERLVEARALPWPVALAGALHELEAHGLLYPQRNLDHSGWLGSKSFEEDDEV